MVLYALANGRIAPAQAIRPRGSLASEVLGALRESILEIVDVPLLPVMWEESDAAGKHGQSLVAIDQDGTVVMVNLRQRLTSVDLYEVVSRSGRYAHTGPVDMAQVYSKGTKEFGPDWEEFRSGRPPLGGVSPRLIVVALDIDEDVLPVFSTLSERVQLLSASIFDTNGVRQVSIEACRKRGSGPSADETVEFLPAPDVESSEETKPRRRGRREAQEFQPTLTIPATPRFTAFPGHIGSHGSQDDADDVTDPAQTLIVEAVEAPLAEQPQPVDAEAGDRPTGRRSRRSAHREQGQGGAREDEPDQRADQNAEKGSQEDPFSQMKIPVIPAWRVTEDGADETPTYISARYDQEVKRPRTEQLLWEKSAPKRDGKRRQPQTFSETTAANASSDAVARAAERELLTPAGRLVAIASRSVTPLTLEIWKNGSPTMATLTSTGTLLLGHTSYQDPSKAAAEVLGRNDVNGWQLWKTREGRLLGEL